MEVVDMTVFVSCHCHLHTGFMAAIKAKEISKLISRKRMPRERPFIIIEYTRLVRNAYCNSWLAGVAVDSVLQSEIT